MSRVNVSFQGLSLVSLLVKPLRIVSLNCGLAYRMVRRGIFRVNYTVIRSLFKLLFERVLRQFVSLQTQMSEAGH